MSVSVSFLRRSWMSLNGAAHIASSCDVVIITMHYGHEALLYRRRNVIMGVKEFFFM
jgi:hypothetical protein